jgi:uncharacterized protein YbjT (DUF2867 family)
VARVLVVGGTGVAGCQVTAEAVRRGHEVSVASRRVPDDDSPAYVSGAQYFSVDIVTAEGLEEALNGIDVLVDTTNGVQRSSRPALTEGALNLLHSAARWGVNRAVLLSIVNVDQAPFAYYRSKAAQERIYNESLLETRVVRTTQFHDLVTAFFASGARFGWVPAFSGVRFQTIATVDVARLLLDAAEGAGTANSTATFGGPEVLTSREMAEQWKRVTRSRGTIIRTPLPGALGKTWRSGQNLVPDAAAGTLRYEDWLTEQA